MATFTKIKKVVADLEKVSSNKVGGAAKQAMMTQGRVGCLGGSLTLQRG